MAEIRENLPTWYQFPSAMAFAATVHQKQVRKYTEVPYICHLLGTASKVIKFGGNETEAIAGLLHDAIEDAGVTQEQLLDQFGGEVTNTNIVLTLTEPKDKTIPKIQRKQAYATQVKNGSLSAVLVSACDKLDNLEDYVREFKEGQRSILGGIKKTYLSLFRQTYLFNDSKRQEILAFHFVLLDIYKRRIGREQPILIDEMEELLRRLY